MKACKRFVALFLALTLVITSTIVGLVLPVAADEVVSPAYEGELIYEETFDDDSAYRYKWKTASIVKGGGWKGSTGYKITAGTTSEVKHSAVSDDQKVVLTAGTYLLRVMVKGGKIQMRLRYNSTYNNYPLSNGTTSPDGYTPYTSEWRMFQRIMTITANRTYDQIGIQLKTDSTLDAYVDNIQIIKIDDTDNLMPAGDMESESQWLHQFIRGNTNYPVAADKVAAVNGTDLPDGYTAEDGYSVVDGYVVDSTGASVYTLPEGYTDTETFGINTSGNVKWLATGNTVYKYRAERVKDPTDENNTVLQLYNATASLADYYIMLDNRVSSGYTKGDPSYNGQILKLSFRYRGGDIYPYFSGNVTKLKVDIIPQENGWYYCELYLHSGKKQSDGTFKSSNANYTFCLKSRGSLIDDMSIRRVENATAIALEDLELESGKKTASKIVTTPEHAYPGTFTWTAENATVNAGGSNGCGCTINGGVVTAGENNGTVTVTSDLTDAEGNPLTATGNVYVLPTGSNVRYDRTVENGTIRFDEGQRAVAAETADTITVDVTPDEGYLMVPGSLCYVMKDGTKVKILNQSMTDFTFGGGTGNTFEFIMPEGAVSVTAEFKPTTEQNFQAQTVGTSVHQAGVDEEGNPTYDGVRFLTRMNLSVKFDENTNALTVLYNGKEYDVEELGSLLKREENETELTYDNAVANTSSTGVDKMWVSKAFTKSSGTFRLLDYTDSYIDFTSVMMTKYIERFYTARGYAKLKDADGNVETILFDELTNSISTVVKILPDAETLPNLSAEKWSPYVESVTVEPGDKLTYTIKVTNNGTEEGPVTVFDPIPTNTTYVEGADDLVGKTAVWTLNLAAGETKEVSCTVQVKDDATLCDGGTIKATTAHVGLEEVACDSTLYVERSINNVDAQYVNTAIQAIADSSYDDMLFVYWTEYVAFSNGHTGFRHGSGYKGTTSAAILESVVHGDGTVDYSYKTSGTNSGSGTVKLLDMIAPTLYGGSEVTGQIEGVKGAPATSVTEENLMIGDVVIVKNNDEVSLYIYCDKGLLQIKSTGGVDLENQIAVLSGLTSSQAYIVLRWRAGLTSTTSTDPETKPVELTPEQEAVIKTGEAFLMRGEKVQYADTDYLANGVPRWAIKQVSPEDASAISWKYTNCAAFCFDSYYFGLGYDMGYMYTTEDMASSSKNKNMRIFDFSRAITDSYTDAEKEETKQQFVDALEPGDLMVIRRKNTAGGTSGHVMMYIGNGKMIHSSGGNMAVDYPEVYEPSIRYGQIEDYFFNPKSLSGYIFGNATDTSDTKQVVQTVIIRPLKTFKGEIPENTTNRVSNLTGVVAQKVASHTVANTVNAGDTITYTYNVRNTNGKAVTLEITDVVPANTTYVSGAETVDGDNLTWTVTVPADDTVEVSFTVKVDADAEKDTLIKSTSGTVGGVVHKVRDITVANTLTAEQQEAIKAATQNILDSGTELRDFELANEIYKQALGIEYDVFASTDSTFIATDETDGVLDTRTSGLKYQLATEGKYREMVVPTIYGGRAVKSDEFDRSRTSLAKTKDVIVGDVIFRRTNSGTVTVYLVVGGNNLLNLTSGAKDTSAIQTRFEYLLSTGQYYVALRPSMTME